MIAHFPACVMLLAVQALPPGETKRQPITNADVVALTQAGVPEDAIILTIRDRLSTFDTSIDALIALKMQGVSDSLIRIMLTAHAASPGAETAGISGAQRQPYALLLTRDGTSLLTPRQAQIAQVKGKHTADDLGSMATDAVVQSLALEAAGRVAANVAIAAGSAAASAILAPLAMGAMLFHRDPTYTYILALPGAASETVVASAPLWIEVQYDRLAGVDPDAYEPLLLRLASTQSNLRLVRAQTVKIKKGVPQATDRILQTPVPTTITKMGRGHVRLRLSDLTPGQYAVLLRSTGPQEALAYPQSTLQQAAAALGSTVWDFGIPSSEASAQ